MGYAIYLLRDGGDYAWFDENSGKKRKAPSDWESVQQAIYAKLKQLNPEIDDDCPDELVDDAGCEIGFYDDGTASINIAGWGDYHTRAPYVRLYLNIFEEYGFSVYDDQAGEKWKPGISAEAIAELLQRFTIPEITKTGKGCKLKPLSDAEWNSMM